MENIQLTEAELEMIRLKREQDELEAKKKEVEKQIKKQKELVFHSFILPKCIDDMLKQIDTFQAKQAQLYEQYVGYLNVFNSFHKSPAYKLISRDSTKNFTAYDYVGGDKVIYQEENIPIKYYEIKRIGYNLKIEIEEVNVGRYHSRYEYRLRYDWKSYKVAKTIDTKINLKIANIEYKKKSEANKLTSKEKIEKELTEKYPEAKLEHKNEWVRGYGKHSEGYEQGYWIVKFENGLELKCKYYEDGSYVPVLEYTSRVLDSLELLELLKNLPKKDK